jgi:DNA polymerase-4
LTTLAAVASAPEQVLVERFGPQLGRDLHRRARFEHDGAVQAARKVVSESRERTFDSDIADPVRLREALMRMAEELCASLARHRRRGRTIGIKVRLDDFTTVTRAHTLPEPTCELDLVRTVALRLLEDYSPPRPVRLLGVRVAGLASIAVVDGDAGARSNSETAKRESADQLALPM